MLKRIFLVVLVLTASLLAILLTNYLRVTSVQHQITPVTLPTIHDGSVERLSASIQQRTVTGDFEPAIFLAFLRRHFPLTHARLNSKVINSGGLVLHWQASATQQKPILFVAHYDVVSVNPKGWTHDPFAGAVDAGFVWGRGSMDDKLSVMAILEAIELLLADGFTPQRDIYVAFGHDEETGGEQGAAQIAAYFAQQGLQFEYVLDEGMLITDGILPFVAHPVALIGIAEKGFADIELRLGGTGGHASMPGQSSLLADMSAAIARLQATPMPARLTTATRDMLKTLAPEADSLSRLLFTNLWLFERILLHRFEQANATHAAIHNTFAMTQMQASDKINVLPNEVIARINVRLLPGASSEQVVAHIRQAIANNAITIQVLQVAEPSAVSATDASGYQQIARTIREVYGQTLVAPALVIPATDSRHYRDLALQTYRFLPITVKQPDLARIHGVDERVPVHAYRDAIRFYYRCMQNSASDGRE